MRAKDFSIDLAQGFEVGEIFLDVDDIPGQAHEMLWPRAALGENGGNIAQRLAHLGNEIGSQMARWVPADHTAGDHKAAVGRHAVGVAFWRRPAARLEYD